MRIRIVRALGPALSFVLVMLAMASSLHATPLRPADCAIAPISRTAAYTSNVAVNAFVNVTACGASSGGDPGQTLACQLSWMNGFFMKGFGGDLASLKSAATGAVGLARSAANDPALLIALSYVASPQFAAAFIADWGWKSKDVAITMMKLASNEGFRAEMMMAMYKIVEQMVHDTLGSAASLSCAEMTALICSLGGEISYHLFPILLAAVASGELGGALGWARLGQVIARYAGRFPKLAQAFRAVQAGIKSAAFYARRGIRFASNDLAERVSLATTLEKNFAGLPGLDAQKYADNVSRSLGEIERLPGRGFREKLRAWIENLKSRKKIDRAQADQLLECFMPSPAAANLTLLPRAYANPSCAGALARVTAAPIDDLPPNLRQRLVGADINENEADYLRRYTRTSNGRTVTDGEADRLVAGLQPTRPNPGGGLLEGRPTGPRQSRNPRERDDDRRSSAGGIASENEVAELLAKRFNYQVVHNPSEAVLDASIDPRRRKEIADAYRAAMSRDGISTGHNVNVRPDFLIGDRVFDAFYTTRADPVHVVNSVLEKVGKNQTARVVVDLTRARNLPRDFDRQLRQELLNSFDRPVSVDQVRRLREIMLIRPGPNGPELVHAWP
ncbi:MAG TPA: hypothetical protein VFV50_03735 [Bdellovibrionales bacterium]|nr:hypothetical protein [Bdellovibrionales bacterium]